MPTLAEQWIQQGEALGLEKGLEKGREEGREAALKVLRRFLATRFGVPLDHFDDVLQPLDLASLTTLSDIAFEIEGLTAFEARLANLQPHPVSDPPK